MVSYSQFTIGKSYRVKRLKKNESIGTRGPKILNFLKNETKKINVSGPIHLREGEKHAGGTSSKASTTQIIPELSGT